MAILDASTPPRPRNATQTRIAGFFVGAFSCLALGLAVSVAFSGGGLGDSRSTPQQVYTSF